MTTSSVAGEQPPIKAEIRQDVVATGFALGLIIFALLKPTEGVHKNRRPSDDANNCTESVRQMVVSPRACSVTKFTTRTFTESRFIHPLSSNRTVYFVVVVGLTTGLEVFGLIILAPVQLKLPPPALRQMETVKMMLYDRLQQVYLNQNTSVSITVGDSQYSAHPSTVRVGMVK